MALFLGLQGTERSHGIHCRHPLDAPEVGN